MSWRVLVTIGGRQRKKHFADYEDAQAQQSAWEVERVAASAAMRPKITRLTQAQIVEAEAAFELLRSSGFSLVDAVRCLLREPPRARSDKTFAAAFVEFLEERRAFVSERQGKNYETVGRRFAEFLGPDYRLVQVTAADVKRWLESLDLAPKSWNNYRSDLASIFSWASSSPRQWVDSIPPRGVPKFRRRETLKGTPERLTVEGVRELMAGMEAEYPLWVTFFAVALFAGVRPEGEMTKLADAVERDGCEAFFRGDALYLPAAVTKDGRARRVPLAANLQEWLRVYPPTSSSLRPRGRDEYASIRARYAVPFDGLRHTSISACAALCGVTEAATRHGNSERIIRDHYLDLFTREQAEAFYQVGPRSFAPAPLHNLAEANA